MSTNTRTLLPITPCESKCQWVLDIIMLCSVLTMRQCVGWSWWWFMGTVTELWICSDQPGEEEQQQPHETKYSQRIGDFQCDACSCNDLSVCLTCRRSNGCWWCHRPAAGREKRIGSSQRAADGQDDEHWLRLSCKFCPPEGFIHVFFKWPDVSQHPDCCAPEKGALCW